MTFGRKTRIALRGTVAIAAGVALAGALVLGLSSFAGGGHEPVVMVVSAPDFPETAEALRAATRDMMSDVEPAAGE